MPKPNPPVIPTQPPPGVPVAALEECSHNHDGQPLLTHDGKRWIYADQRWQRVFFPQKRRENA